MTVAQLPRLSLANLPTPLIEAPRLRAALGGGDTCPRIFIKRDDLTGLATGGNKARKLEYSVAQAVADGATVLVTTGALQSNHARSVAAAARIAGMQCVLILTGEPGRPEGNLVLDHLLGATIHFVADAPGGFSPGKQNPHEVEAIERTRTELRNAGEVPYVVPLGASDEIGTVGYVEAARELGEQLRRAGVSATRVYVGAGTRGTQAGLVLGAAMLKAPWKVHGIAISPGDPGKTEGAVEFTNRCSRRIGSGVKVRAEDFITHQEYYGASYAAPTPECREAIALAARTEALILDPVYTGKAMAGLIDHIRRGDIPPTETVVFMHTGGTAAIFAQQSLLGL
jgi:D-cysteine desulfhydrase family pyridoxal phosphate-dependent enzyme